MAKLNVLSLMLVIISFLLNRDQCSAIFSPSFHNWILSSLGRVQLLQISCGAHYGVTNATVSLVTLPSGFSL